MPIVAPSLLSADFSRLGEEIEDVKNAGAEWLHVDVMDGQFVPNISIGIPVLQSVRKVTDLVLDVHLMIAQPHRFVKRFCEAGADGLSFHVEADTPEKISESLDDIHALGKKAGLVVKPGTQADALLPWLNRVDYVLVMTVEPGFGGQKFMEDMLPKIRQLNALRLENGWSWLLEADGGVNAETAKRLTDAGVDVLVAGSSVFGATDRKSAIAVLR